MGKKSKAERKAGKSKGVAKPSSSSQASFFLPSDDGAAAAVPTGPLPTSSPTLQAKLDQLVALAASNDRAGFVTAFVPLDLSPEDALGYLGDLTTAEEAEGQWTNLVAEMTALRAGAGVTRIEGDQATSARFFFQHPLLPGCDREVAFTCVGGEWRADG